MMKSFRLWSAMGSAVLGLGMFAGNASASTVTKVVISTTNGSESAQATAIFTFSASTLTIDLTNDYDNPHAAGSLLGGITFTLVKGGSGAATGFAASGPLINVTGNLASNVTTVSSQAALSAWSVSGLSPYDIQVGGNDPLIIGNPTASGAYSAANASITNGSHLPFIEKTGHFTMTISGITDTTDVSNVSFLFGTTYTSLNTGETITPHVPLVGGPSPIPLPSALPMGGAMLAAMGLFASIKKRRMA